MSAKKIRIKCADCGTINLIPATEVGFRRNAEGMTICRMCCRKFRWESKACATCSDRVFCSGKFKENTLEFLDNISGA